MEAADDLQRRLGYGLVEVTACGRNGSADRNRADVAVFKLYAARALVERGDTAFEVCGERLFAGNLLESARKFAHGLRPAGGGVGENEYVESLLTEIFGERNRRINRRFTRGDRHRRGVADDDRALHERLARLRVDDLGEFLQSFDNLARALAASGGNHDIYLRVARGRLLKNGLARAEGAGNAVCPADGHGEERVDRAHRRLKRFGRRETLDETLDRNFDWPALEHLDFNVFPVRVSQRRDVFNDGVVALAGEFFDRERAAKRKRHHNLMTGHRLVVENSLGNPAENVARRNALAYLGRRMPVPFSVTGKAGQVYAALKEVLGVR